MQKLNNKEKSRRVYIVIIMILIIVLLLFFFSDFSFAEEIKDNNRIIIKINYSFPARIAFLQYKIYSTVCGLGNKFIIFFKTKGLDCLSIFIGLIGFGGGIK